MINIKKYLKEIKDIKQDINKITNQKVLNLLYTFGRLLHEIPDEIDKVYEYLYSIYGNTIIFSRRSLLFAKLFYEKYQQDINLVPNNITWNQCVMLLRKKYCLSKDIYIFGVIELFSLNEKEIDYFLDTGNIRFILGEENVNNIVIEFINL